MDILDSQWQQLVHGIENTRLYGDLEWDIDSKLRIGLAYRWEDYDTFGTTENYKLGFNYKAAEDFGFRGTFSTGFKAPTPGQSNAKKVSTVFNSSGDLVNEGVIPSTLPLSQTLWW